MEEKDTYAINNAKKIPSSQKTEIPKRYGNQIAIRITLFRKCKKQNESSSFPVQFLNSKMVRNCLKTSLENKLSTVGALSSVSTKV